MYLMHTGVTDTAEEIQACRCGSASVAGSSKPLTRAVDARLLLVFKRS